MPKAYGERQAEGFSEGFDAGYLRAFAQGVLGRPSSPYGDAFADSYQRGWDEAARAAAEAARAISLPSDAGEFRALADMVNGASALQQLTAITSDDGSADGG